MYLSNCFLWTYYKHNYLIIYYRLCIIVAAISDYIIKLIVVWYLTYKINLLKLHAIINALEAGPWATHSYQANNLFIIPLWYFTVLSASLVQKWVKFKKKYINIFYWLRKSYYWSDYVHLSYLNQSVKSAIGRQFLVCLQCVYECHDVTACDVMTTI